MRARVYITTSLRPTRRVRSFCKDLRVGLGDAIYVNRGKKNFEEVVLEALKHGAKSILVVNTRKGNPGRVDLYRITNNEARLIVSIVCSGIKLLREMKIKPPLKAIKSVRLTVDPNASDELKKLANTLSEGLSIPIEGLVGGDDAGLLIVEPDKKHLGRLRFICAKNQKPIGPLVVLKKYFA
ncbi:MAG: hypothetical protein QXK12_03245 [Candidatus Nezhaarchaeales archaeon]